MTTIRIGAVVKECRESKGLTQERLAELINTSPGLISQIERDITLPSVQVLAKMIDVLGIDANTLFYDNINTHAYREITIRAARLSTDKQEFLLNFLTLLERSFNFP